MNFIIICTACDDENFEKNDLQHGLLALKTPNTTAVDDKICDIFMIEYWQDKGYIKNWFVVSYLPSKLTAYRASEIVLLFITVH